LFELSEDFLKCGDALPIDLDSLKSQIHKCLILVFEARKIFQPASQYYSHIESLYFYYDKQSFELTQSENPNLNYRLKI